MKGKNVSFFLHFGDLLECDINLANFLEFLVQNLPVEDLNYHFFFFFQNLKIKFAK